MSFPWSPIVARFVFAFLLSAFVVDLPAAEPTGTSAPRDTTIWSSLPEAVSSFGACACDGWLYVYSGHIGTSHEHSRANLSQRFMRMNLNAPSDWETLTMSEPLQGMPLVSYEHMIYRVGGLRALNDKGEAENLVSIADVERYDPSSGKWQAIQPLPEGRSSHDAAVVDGVLYVLGGWGMSSEESKWFEHGWKLKLNDPSASWEKVPQPFRRRALSIVADEGKILVLGGLTEKGPSGAVDVLDTLNGQWHEGPVIPGKPIDGMACSSVELRDNVYISNMAGGVFRFDGATNAWTEVGKLEQPRFHHRFVPLGDHRFLAIGGASMTDGVRTSIEVFDIDR